MKSRRASFKHIGGSHGGAIDDPRKPVIGQGKVGSSVHHSSAKAKENCCPPSAKSHASFSSVGGKSKTNI